jgi:hypothetical protein
MTLHNDHDQRGRFTPGHQPYGRPFTSSNTFATGRPPGSPNKPYDTGKELFFERHIDSAVADRFCGLVVGIVADLGGEDNLSNGELQLIRRCAMISTQCEIMEVAAAEGKPFDIIAYCLATNCLTRALKALGLKRQPRDITPTLKDYLDAVRQPIEPEAAE